MAVSIREKPPLRLSVDATAPEGTHARWGWDEPAAANTPNDLSFSDSMPGGYDSFSATLPRRAGVDYGDLGRLSTLRVQGVGGEVAGEYRLEAAPRVSGDQFAVSPEAVGWQKHLEDDQTAREIYVDRDLGNWGEPTRARRVQELSATRNVVEGMSVEPDGSGIPAIALRHQVAASDTAYITSEAWYDALGMALESVYYDWVITGGAAADQQLIVRLSTDDILTSSTSSGDLFGTATGTGSVTTTSTTREWAQIEFANTATYATDAERVAQMRRISVWGQHGLTKQGTAPDDGLYASDVIANAISRWAPLLSYSTGANGTIKPTSFIIPHLVFREPTTAAEILTQANRFHLDDWAVWEDKTFYFHPRGDRGRNWRARIAPSQLSETGPDVERLWNAVIVAYQDVDGVTRTVGPTGANADTTSDLLLDTDPENPANQLGIRKWVRLDMGITSTPAGAQEVGRRFLEESKQLDGSGQAQLVGYVEDDKGITRPAWQVHAGDTITFVDAADKSARRIVRREYSDASKTATIDIDAPPQGLDALLERLGVVLVPLGF